MHQIREDKGRIREIELLKWEHDSEVGGKKEREGEREEHLHRLEKGR